MINQTLKFCILWNSEESENVKHNWTGSFAIVDSWNNWDVPIHSWL